MLFQIYGFAHKCAKKFLNKNKSKFKFISLNVDCNLLELEVEDNGAYINDIDLKKGQNLIESNALFPVENVIPLSGINLNENFNESFKRRKKENIRFGINESDSEKAWYEFINASFIGEKYKYGNLSMAAYILECQTWCLPSWIWTNAAIVRLYCKTGDIKKAQNLLNILIKLQDSSGGWIVRNDYSDVGAIPMLAPNDSAYIANNACLELYSATNEPKYLESAIRCADWIINTARNDGMVLLGFDVKRKIWKTENNIVDVGFTAGLFANLYEYTKKIEYLDFLRKFTNAYINLFYIKDKKGFTTSLDKNDNKIGGMFARGQAWALEGLIPAYRVLKNKELYDVINDTVDMLIQSQSECGAWHYNLTKPLMGFDCKGVPIIAYNILKWILLTKRKKEDLGCCNKALKWCIENTCSSINSDCYGGIFSYSTEGAIVHNMYTSTAMVYSSAYAIELKRMLEEIK